MRPRRAHVSTTRRAPTPVASLPVVLAALALAALGGCQADGAGPAPSVTYAEGPPGPYYELVVDVDRVRGLMTVTSNGLPVWREPRFVGVADNQFADALGPGLVSGRNVAAFEVRPGLRRGGPAGPSGWGRSLVVPDQRFSLGVWSADGPRAPGGGYVRGTRVEADAVAAALVRWEAALQREWPRWLASEDALVAAGRGASASEGYGGAALDSAWAWAAAHPFRVETAWVREGGPGGRPGDGGPSFDGLLRDGPVIAGTPADSARLRAYAVRLLALERAGDRAALAAEYRPAFEHGVDAEYVGADAATRDSLVADALTRLPPLGSAEPFAERDVRLRSWAGGRVWELYRDGAPALITVRPPPAPIGPDGQRELSVTTTLSPYVAVVGGRLRVVRFVP